MPGTAGKTAYVTQQFRLATPIHLATNTLGTAIPFSEGVQAIAIIRDGKTAYVANGDDNTVTPIDLATKAPSTPIAV